MKARHIHPNLCQDSCSSGGLQPGNGLYQLHRFLKGVQTLLDFLLNVSDGLVQKVNMSQDALEQKAMMGLHASIQGQAQVGELGTQPPAG